MTSHRSHHSSQPHSSTSAGFSYPSKPHVLAGLQDVYWSDEESEDNSCPLCMEELDLEERQSKPCQCGYRICRFCFHHIRENLNARCPACRREYLEENVIWKPVSAEDNKRLQQQKRKREKELKDLDQLGRRHFLDMRIVQRNVVYVMGVGRKFAKEEMIPILRSSDYFGQYGKITKILLHKRTAPGSTDPVLGVYITYQRPEDAARAIEKIDGSPSPSGDGEVMHASFGTAKYCTSFLRGVSCSNSACMDAHEWREERDCFTRQDLASIKHHSKETEKRSILNTQTTVVRKADEAPSLPRTASWATPRSTQPSVQVSTTPAPTATTPQTIQLGPPGPVMRSGRQPRSRQSAKSSNVDSGRTRERRNQTAPVASNSRPATPAERAPLPTKPIPIAPAPASTAVADTPSNVSSPQVATSAIGSDDSLLPSSAPKPTTVVPPPGLSAPPGLAQPPQSEVSSPEPAGPPGLSRPPGLAPPPAQQNSAADNSQKGYQMSSQAQALLNDLRARREAAVVTPPPPFPDFDRTLSNLSLNTGFSFSFAGLTLADSPLSSAAPSRKGSTFDPFASPSMTNTSTSSQTRSRNTFDPFGDAGFSKREDLSDGSRMSSRFDFARRTTGSGSLGREGSIFSNSPRNVYRSETLTGNNAIYNTAAVSPRNHSQSQWFQNTGHPQDYSMQSLMHPSAAHNFEQTTYNEPSVTQFHGIDMPETMEELVRGFETPSLEQSVRHLEQQQAQAAFSLQHHGQYLAEPQSYLQHNIPPSPGGPMNDYAPRMQSLGVLQSSRLNRQENMAHRLASPSTDGSMPMSISPYNVTSPIPPAEVTSNGEFHRLPARGRVY